MSKKTANKKQPKQPKPEQPEVTYLSVDLIRTYWRNPRFCEEAVPFVVESIKRYGFNVPLVVDSKHMIICGHTRYRAARQMGMKEVPVIVADMTEERAKQFRIADNKTSEMAKWDEAKLRDEMNQMAALGDVRRLFGGPKWDAILNMAALPQFAHEGSQADYKTNGEISNQFEVCCPHCGQENVIKLTDIGKEQ